MTKQQIRLQVRENKRMLSQLDIENYSKEIIRNLFTCSCYKNASEVYTYVSYNQEVNTKEFINQALRDGKKVAVPKVLGEEMEFFYITSLDQVEEGYQHIFEPVTKDRAVPSEVKSPLMIMPGLAFDKSGNRIGYGGGFYDKYLLKYNDAFSYKCALGYEFQLFDEFEVESTDVPVNLIITPKSIIDINETVRTANREEVIWNI